MNEIFKTRKGSGHIGFSSLSPAQRQQQVQRFTNSVTKTEQAKKPKMDHGPRYGPGTLGRRYKGKYVSIPVGKGTSRRRYVDHGHVEASHCLYTTFSDMGPRAEFVKTLAESIILHYMHRCGDYRVNLRDAALGPTTFDTNVATGTTSTWKTMRLQWRQKNTSTTEVMVSFDLDAWTVAQTNPSNDATVVHTTFTSMVDLLAANIITYATSGYELASITMFRGDRASSLNGQNQYTQTMFDQAILHDTSAGRNLFKFSTSAKFKIQNTTDADEGDLHSKDNIHANPLDGLVYKFKNRVPKFQPSFLSSLSPADADIVNDLENLASASITGLSPSPLHTAAGNQFHVPPPLPYTIFSNSAGRSKVLIKPGEHRVFALKETFSSSVNEFIRRYMTVSNGGVTRDIPSGGNCLMIALKPTFRTGTNEDVEIQYEVERTLHGLIQRKKLTTIPITNIMS